jgi:hypothetical protein
MTNQFSPSIKFGVYFAMPCSVRLPCDSLSSFCSYRFHSDLFRVKFIILVSSAATSSQPTSLSMQAVQSRYQISVTTVEIVGTTDIHGLLESRRLVRVRVQVVFWEIAIRVSRSCCEWRSQWTCVCWNVLVVVLLVRGVIPRVGRWCVGVDVRARLGIIGVTR